MVSLNPESDKNLTELTPELIEREEVKFAKPLYALSGFAKPEGEDAQEKKIKLGSQESLEKEEFLYGFLNHENPTYKKAQKVLDRVLKAARISADDVKLDIALNPSVNAHVYPYIQHIVVYEGTLDVLSEDEIAAILAHELVHVKYTGKKTPKDPNDFFEYAKFHTLSKEEEQQADIEAIEIINAAGYNPNALLAFFDSENFEIEYYDYIDFATKGFKNITQEEHEVNERRVRYLDRHISNHLYKHRDKPFDDFNSMYPIDDEDFGFINWIMSMKLDKALDMVEEPWQLCYLAAFVENFNDQELHEKYQSRIEELKASFFDAYFDNLSKKEIDILWMLMTISDYDESRDSKILADMSDEVISNIFLELPQLFPDAQSKYLGLPGTSNNEVNNEYSYGPTDKLVGTLLSLEPARFSKVLTDILNEWTKESPNPEWISALMTSISEYGENVMIPKWDEYDVVEFFTHLSDVLANYDDLPNKALVCLTKLYTSAAKNIKNADYFSQFITVDCVSFISINLSTNKVDSDYGELMEAKEGFFNIYTQELVSRNRENEIDEFKVVMLNATKGMPLHNRDKIMKHYFYHQETGKYEKSIFAYKKFPWEQIQGDESDDRYNFWSFYLENMLSKKTSGFFDIDGVLNDEFLNLDFTAEEFARMIFNGSFASLDTRFIDLNKLIVLLENSKSPKAKRILDIYNLAKRENGPSENKSIEEFIEYLSSIPDIPEKNSIISEYLNSLDINIAMDSLLKLRDSFVQEDPDDIKERINERFSSNELMNDIMEGVLSGGVSGVYEDIYLGKANKIMDQVSAFVWNKFKRTAEFTKMPFEARMKLINSAFPNESVKKEEAIVEDSGYRTIKQMKIALKQLKLPPFRYQLGQKLWDLRKEKLIHAPLTRKMKVLQECFPEPSFYRDDLIKDVLLNSNSTRKQVEKYKKLLFNPQRMLAQTDQEVFHLFMLRVLSRSFYFADRYAKVELFQKFVEEERKENYQTLLTKDEKQVLLESLFSGPENATQNDDFFDVFDGLFLQMGFDKEIVEKLLKLKKLKRKHVERYEKYFKDVDERIETGDFNPLNTLDPADDRFEGGDEMIGGYDLMNLNDVKAEMRSLEASLPPEIFTDFPNSQVIFKTILSTYDEKKRAQILAKFLTRIFHGEIKDAGDIVVAFLETLGVAYIKAGQILASLGFFDKDLQLKLLKLSDSVKNPVDVFRVWHILTEELGDKADEFIELGPMLANASIRQTHKARLQNNEQRVVKIKRPDAIHDVGDSLKSVEQFVQLTKKDAGILKGIMLPEDLIAEVQGVINEEVLRDSDKEKQEWFRDHFHGIELGGKTLYIPVIDHDLSTLIVTTETKAPGEPLSVDLDSITPETKEALIKFFFELIFKEGLYHADPHPGNVLEDDDNISLIDFGMTGTLNKENKQLFKTLLFKLLGQDQEGLLEYLMVSHELNGGEIEKLNLPLVKQEIEAFFEDFSQDEFDFQDTSLVFLNTLENLKIKLPSEIKILIKTLSQMSYLLDGDSSTLIATLMSDIESDDDTFEKTRQEVLKVLQAASESMNEEVVHIGKGSLIKYADVKDQADNLVLAEDIEIDREKITGTFVMLKMEGGASIGVVKGKHNYEVFYGGKWRYLDDLIFGAEA